MVVYHERRVRLAFSSHDAFRHRPSYQLGEDCFNLSSSELSAKRSFVIVYNAVVGVRPMIDAAVYLRKRFGSDVDMSVAAIHLDFQRGEERVLLDPETNPFSSIVAFDTVPHTAGLDGKGPFHILPCADYLASA